VHAVLRTSSFLKFEQQNSFLPQFELQRTMETFNMQHSLLEYIYIYIVYKLKSNICCFQKCYVEVVKISRYLSTLIPIIMWFCNNMWFHFRMLSIFKCITWTKIQTIKKIIKHEDFERN
jgi:hypothetical protein